VDKLLTSNDDIISESNDSLNIKIIETRENLIDQLSTLHTYTAKINAKISAAISCAKDNQIKDLSAAKSLLTKLKNVHTETVKRTRNDTQLHPAANTKTYANIAITSIIPEDIKTLKSSVSAPTAAANKHLQMSKYSKIKFTEALYLNAIKILTFHDVKQDGELYYVESADHFAIKMNGTLFHGNIGTIYTDEKNPEKIKDCKFASSCIKQNKCDYYHNPLKFAGSRDKRNFIASSWLYAPPDSLYKNRPRSRRFGSRNHLDIDIVGLQEEEINRFHDQMMHDLLCSLLIVQSYSQK
jgi:hypothetical protein